VDGCFWHSCPIHGTIPKTNAEWWWQKLATNRQRDLETDRLLAGEGWVSYRVWEHDDPAVEAKRIEELLFSRGS
jgi:DNA mismatch endonuclease (patch repair protein)